MREVALSSIEAYVSAKEEEIEKLLSKGKTEAKKKTNSKEKTNAKKNGGKNG